MASRVPKHNVNSMETILTFDNRDNLSDWSTEWSTTYIPGMHNAAGRGPNRREAGRRRLRLGSLAVGSALVIHCRVASSSLTGGFVIYYLALVVAVVMLANPMRHFEVYLGQWSISGPGRAFRIIPMLDGIGIAMCINCIVRAINCCAIAALILVYVVYSTADAPLPFTYCRDWNLNRYDPIIRNVSVFRLRKGRFSLASALLSDNTDNVTQRPKIEATTVGLQHHAWRPKPKKLTGRNKATFHNIQMCKESFRGGYPSLYATPAYNYFYVEVAKLKPEIKFNFGVYNLRMLICNVCIWLSIWVVLISERITHGRLIWNNIFTWLVVVPWVWAVYLLVAASVQATAPKRLLFGAFKVSGKEILTGVTDALEIALYIHSAGTGTELILGKGLNFFASGHIDPDLNGENVWHSGLLLALAGLHCCGAAICALADYAQPDTGGKQSYYDMDESSLWIIPMYSKCTLTPGYSHATASVIFGGLCFSYIIVAFVLIKTALHIIFEYRVKLVFVEQLVVALVIIGCMLLSVPYYTFGGVVLLEGVEAMTSGLAMPLLCGLQLLALLVLYHSHDFVSDMNVATEENTCSTRINTQWHIIPFIIIIVLIAKIVALSRAELPAYALGAGAAPLVAAALAVPIRACHNAYVFLRPAPRRGV